MYWISLLALFIEMVSRGYKPLELVDPSRPLKRKTCASRIQVLFEEMVSRCYKPLELIDPSDQPSVEGWGQWRTQVAR